MQAIPLGRINVPTAGTDVPLTLTAAQLALTQNGLVCKVEVWPDTGNTGNLLARQGGVTMGQLPKPASGYVQTWVAEGEEGNTLDPTKLALGAVTNGDGGFVTLWVL